MRRNQPEDVWKHIDVRGHDECWPWKMATAGGGYAQFAMGCKLHMAHRVAAHLYSAGAIDIVSPRKGKGAKVLMHTCDNRRCCNPHHLIEGLQRDNIQDAVLKGRFKSNKGINNPRAILDPEKISRIKCRIESGETRAAIAREMNLSWTCIDAAYKGRSWT